MHCFAEFIPVVFETDAEKRAELVRKFKEENVIPFVEEMEKFYVSHGGEFLAGGHEVLHICSVNK